MFIAMATLAEPEAVSSQPTRATTDMAPGSRWIVGSWVDVRATPLENGEVVTRLKVNTEVHADGVVSRTGFCGIAWGDGQHGFVTCESLGDRALRIEDIANYYLPDGRTKNPAYSPTRAFWLEPSLERLWAAGQYFESKFLSDEERAKEQALDGAWDTKPIPKRSTIPEYEAMKAVMRNGIVGVFPTLEPSRFSLLSRKLAPWEELKALAEAGDPSNQNSMYNELRSLQLNWGYRDPSVSLLRAIELPIVGASLFKHENEIGRPLATTEEISAKFAIPYQATVLTGPQWIPGGHYNGPYVFGAWDAGAIETKLTREVFKHTLYASGKIVSERDTVKGGKQPPHDADDSECNLGFSLGDASPQVWKALPSFVPKPVSVEAGDAKLFYFYSKVPLQYTQSKGTEQVRSFDAEASQLDVDVKFNTAGFTSATERYFDVDLDGVMDLLMWEGTGWSKQEIHDPGGELPHYRMIFMNIDAKWYLLAVDEFLFGCGC
jgi:hypothetical protein